MPNNQFTAEKTIEIQETQEKLEKTHHIAYMLLFFAEFYFKTIFSFSNIYFQSTELDKEQESSSLINYQNLIIGICSLSLIAWTIAIKKLGAFNYLTDQRREIQIVKKILDTLSPQQLSKNIINSFNIDMTAEEIDHQLKFIKDVAESNANNQTSSRYGSFLLAGAGIIDLFYTPPVERSATIIAAEEVFAHARYIFFIELAILTWQVLHHHLIVKPSIQTKKHSQQLNEWFLTSSWTTKEKTFPYFSIEATGGQIFLTLPNQTERSTLSSTQYLSALARCLLAMNIPILFFSEQQMIIRDWHYPLSKPGKHVAHFQRYIRSYLDNLSLKQSKSAQLLKIIKSFSLEFKYKSVETFENDLPQIEFVFEIPSYLFKVNKNETATSQPSTLSSNISIEYDRRVLELHHRFSVLYGEENILLNDNLLIVSGCKCVDEKQLTQATQTVETFNFNHYHQPEVFTRKTNKKEKQEQKDEKETPLSKADLLRRNNILNKSKLNADEIAKQLTIHASETSADVYYPLEIPKKPHGSSYAKVNRLILENQLKKDKNWSTDQKSLEHCIETLKQGRVGWNVNASNDMHTIKLPNGSENNNNNQPQPSKWLARSFYSVKHERVNVHATTVSKELVGNPPMEIDCYHFDYVKRV